MMPRTHKQKARHKSKQTPPLEFAHLNAPASEFNSDSVSASAASVSQEKSQKKKAKRKRSDDGAYSKRSKTNKKKKAETDSGNILHLRANSSLTVTDGELEVEKKTAAILRTTPMRVNKTTKKLLEERFSEHQSKIKTNRPISEVTQRSATGTPLQVRTPGKSLLHLRSKNGVLYGFSNEPGVVLESPQRSIDPSFSSTSPATKVKPNPHKVKKVKTLITPESLQMAEQEIRANSGQRSISQNALMAATGVAAKKASATQYAKAAKLASGELRWEWLHLVAHYVLASKAQDENNLGAGTYHANTEMLGAELALPRLAKLFPQGFWLEVTAHFIPGQQILTTIEYTITTDKFVLPFTFNAQQKNQPDVYNLSYINALIDTFKDIHTTAKEESELEAVTSSVPPDITRSARTSQALFEDEEEGVDENENALNLPLFGGSKPSLNGLFSKMPAHEKITPAAFTPLSPFKSKK